MTDTRFKVGDEVVTPGGRRARIARVTLAVYEWIGTGDSWHAGIGRRMVQTRVAVVRRRVAA